jgi:hypothetical protein
MCGRIMFMTYKNYTHVSLCTKSIKLTFNLDNVCLLRLAAYPKLLNESEINMEL